MAHFTPAGAAHAARFIHRIGREIVVQHEIFAVFTGQRINHLFILAGAECGDAQRLGFTTREQRRAMRARQHAHFRHDGAHGARITPVNALAGIKDVVADHIRFQFLEQALRQVHIGTFGFKGGDHLLLHHAHLILADQLLYFRIGNGHIGAAQFGDALLQRDFSFRRLRQRPGFLGGNLSQFNDRLDHRLEGRMTKGDGAEHDFFRQFARFRFHHQHAFGSAGQHQIQHAFLALISGWVQHIGAVDIANARRADRAEEGNAGKRQRGGATHQGDDIGIIFQIMRQDGSNHLDFIAEAFREKRADRAVNQARRQRFEFGRPAFTLEEATRDLAGGEGLFLVMHGQREEILPRLRRTRTNGGAQHNGVTQAGHHGTIGLAGDLAAFQNQGLAAPGDFLAEVIVEHRHPLGRWPMPARTTPHPLWMAARQKGPGGPGMRRKG